MGLLTRGAALALASLGACYEPDVRDCTVTCAGSGDCAAGQICGSDHLCASSAIAGTCARRMDDAGLPTDPDAERDPPLVDAATLDAASTVLIHIHIDGKGRVELDGGGACASGAPDNGDCLLPAPPGVPATLHAVPAVGQIFDAWTTAPCAVQPGTTCTFTPVAPILVGARFKKAT